MSDDPVEEARDRLDDAMNDFLNTPEPPLPPSPPEAGGWDEEAIREYVEETGAFFREVLDVREYLDDNEED